MILVEAHLRVARPTNDIEALLPFYCRGLGFVRLAHFAEHEGFDGIMLGPAERNSTSQADSERSNGDDDPLMAGACGYHLEFTRKRDHDAGRAPTRDNLLVFYLPDKAIFAAAVNRMVAAGFPPVPSFNPYWDRCGKTFEDPDGYRVVLANTASPV